MYKDFRGARRFKFQGPFMIWRIAMLFLGGLIVMLLWNVLMPEIFSFKTLNYWQATGLLLLTRILTGNFRRGGPGPGFRGRGVPPHIIEKWKTMTPEERQQFKEQWRNRCHNVKRKT